MQDGELNWFRKQGQWLGKDSQKTKKDGNMWYIEYNICTLMVSLLID